MIYQKYTGENELKNIGRKNLLLSKDEVIKEQQEEIERLNKELDIAIDICNKRQVEIVRLNNIIDKAIKDLFKLKDIIYKPETREENFEMQRKISSIIKILGSDKE